MVNPQTPELRNIDGDRVWEENNNPKNDTEELRYSNLIKKNNDFNDDSDIRKISDTATSQSPIVSYEDDGSHGVPSAQCSDVDDDVDFVEIDDHEESGGWMTNLPISSVEHETSNGQVLPSLDKTTFGQVCISNSNHVRVGNTTLYKGPVTIKQFVYTNSASVENGEIGSGKRASDVNSNEENNVTNSTTPIFPAPREYDKVIKWLWTWRCAALLSVVALILVTVIVVVSVMNTRNDALSPLGPAIDPDDILTEDVRFVKRIEWGAQPPTNPANPLQILPAPYVIISHTASEPCSTQAECSQRVRTAQTMHIEWNKWDDIGYNFLVGGDGLAYVGRGWDVEGAHTFNYNKKSIGISCIGTFNTVTPPKRQLVALARVIETGVKHGKIAKDYKLMGHRQLTETLSPGDMLYRIIKKWKHWSEKP
ncbi:peptidoglycan-recognition protein LC [Diachasma alloeum]|uniref:peptidoglycan-recognition protein LC n=1 Tax=Diachasma alloeum TaxID=454923 RepID=UPI00073812DA|nr:peptidoglycan-recognition protein LC [Diachasma alloeum]